MESGGKYLERIAPLPNINGGVRPVQGLLLLHIMMAKKWDRFQWPGIGKSMLVMVPSLQGHQRRSYARRSLENAFASIVCSAT